MSAYALHCRVCEDVTRSAPSDACRRCDGPTDVAYDWDRVRRTISREQVAAGPASLWRYGNLLPAGARVEVGAGWTPLVPARRLSELFGIELHLKLETANPTLSFKDRVAVLAVSAALDHGVTTLCCSSTGNLGDAVAAAAAATGLEAIVLAPAGEAAEGLGARVSAARVFAVDGSYDDCRRLELELGALFPWGFVDGNLSPYASEGAKTISFEIAEQLGWRMPDAVVCPAASGTLFAKLAQGFAEVVHARLGDESFPRLFAAQAEGASPIASAYADDRVISRVQADTSVRSLAVGNPAWGDLAIGAARTTGGTIIAVSEPRIDAHTRLLAETTGVFADRAGGAALGALLQALRDGAIEPGARVVLIVTGAGIKPYGRRETPSVTVVEPRLEDLLPHLGERGGH
jgi:threonine synthase